MFAIIDVETTGINGKSSKITEIAIYKHDGNKIVDQFTTLINPQERLTPFIMRLTGITDEMLKDAPKFYEVAKQIVQFTEHCTFVAHNVAFDYAMVRSEFSRLGYNYLRPRLCTIKLAQKLFPGLPKYNLKSLCQHFGIELDNHHRASADAYATTKIFEHLIQENTFAELFAQAKRTRRQ